MKIFLTLWVAVKSDLCSRQQQQAIIEREESPRDTFLVVQFSPYYRHSLDGVLIIS